MIPCQSNCVSSTVEITTNDALTDAGALAFLQDNVVYSNEPKFNAEEVKLFAQQYIKLCTNECKHSKHTVLED